MLAMHCLSTASEMTPLLRRAGGVTLETPFEHESHYEAPDHPDMHGPGEDDTLTAALRGMEAFLRVGATVTAVQYDPGIGVYFAAQLTLGQAFAYERRYGASAGPVLGDLSTAMAFGDDSGRLRYCTDDELREWQAIARRTLGLWAATGEPLPDSARACQAFADAAYAPLGPGRRHGVALGVAH